MTKTAITPNGIKYEIHFKGLRLDLFPERGTKQKEVDTAVKYLKDKNEIFMVRVIWDMSPKKEKEPTWNKFYRDYYVKTGKRLADTPTGPAEFLEWMMKECYPPVIKPKA